MKNLLIYVNPKGFDPESKKLTKIQIDNSLQLGWKPEDIHLVTNFKYRYRSVEAFVIENGFCSFQPQASKVTALVNLFDIGFFNDNIYWCHDLDAFQLEVISEKELGLKQVEGGFCDYCRIPRWQMGSFFFKKSLEDIIRLLAKNLTPPDEKGRHLNEEDIMMSLTANNTNNINGRIKKLNGTYDFGMRRIDYCFQKANKPLKVLHFHPQSKQLNTLAIAMYGRNRLRKPLMNDRLIKIFKKYGYS